MDFESKAAGAVKAKLYGRWEQALMALAPSLAEAIEKKAVMSVVRSIVARPIVIFGLSITSMKPVVSCVIHAARLPMVC